MKINKTFVVAYQDQDDDPHFLLPTEFLGSPKWTTNIVLADQFPTFNSAKAKQYEVELDDDSPTFTLVVMTYQSIFNAFTEPLEEIIDSAVKV